MRMGNPLAVELLDEYYGQIQTYFERQQIGPNVLLVRPIEYWSGIRDASNYQLHRTNEHGVFGPYDMSGMFDRDVLVVSVYNGNHFGNVVASIQRDGDKRSVTLRLLDSLAGLVNLFLLKREILCRSIQNG